MKTRISWGGCVIYVEGTEMNCPLCKVLVKSGERHQCEQKPAITAKRKSKAPR